MNQLNKQVEKRFRLDPIDDDTFQHQAITDIIPFNKYNGGLNPSKVTNIEYDPHH